MSVLTCMYMYMSKYLFVETILHCHTYACPCTSVLLSMIFKNLLYCIYMYMYLGILSKLKFIFHVTNTPRAEINTNVSECSFIFTIFECKNCYLCYFLIQNVILCLHVD